MDVTLDSANIKHRERETLNLLVDLKNAECGKNWKIVIFADSIVTFDLDIFMRIKITK